MKYSSNANEQPSGQDLAPSEPRLTGSSLLCISCNHTPSSSSYYTTPIDRNTNHDFYCNSKSWLERSKQALTQSRVNLFQCLSSDFELESGILTIIIATLGISFKYLHIKSYQDNKKDVHHRLPWTAQMNVHVNTLATNNLDNYAAPSKIVPVIPTS